MFDGGNSGQDSWPDGSARKHRLLERTKEARIHRATGKTAAQLPRFECWFGARSVKTRCDGTSDLPLWRTVQWACCISVPRPLFVNVSMRVCVCVRLFFLHLLEVFLLLAIFVFSLNELSCSSRFETSSLFSLSMTVAPLFLPGFSSVCFFIWFQLAHLVAHSSL